ncbi:MAG: cytochrome d ubiquinol oxidase subunit II [Lentimicrobiaceae bacterium]|nr:cytochrome d ubiquinol oxidase subunit II [Lentimicrobiaceae bacterium]
MFETLSLLALQQYWWVIISFLAGILVFLMFVQGGGTLIYILGKNENERTLLVNSLGRKWEFTFTTLVTFGGAFFASFPLFYATSFGGAYWVWMLILFSFVIQAISYEYRTKPHNFLGQKTYETFLFINGLLGTILIGTAVSTFFTGSQFSVNELNQSRWETPLHGIEAAFNFQNLLLGLAIFFLARMLGLQYFMNNIKNKAIYLRVHRQLAYAIVPFLVFFLLFIGLLFTQKGFAYQADTREVVMEPYKYLHNLLEMPIVSLLFLGGVAFVLVSVYLSFFKKSTSSIWYSSIGTILTVFSLFLIAGFNNTAFYPSTFDLQDSLTIENASSSHYTLTVMAYVSLLVPFVLAYIYWAWKSINKKPIDLAELDEEEHLY